MFKWVNPKTKTEAELSIPDHVAIIMDGNGRWAKKRGLPRIMGHREGMKSVREAVRTAQELGIRSLTLYAFSTENWTRPEEEVNFLMKLPKQFLETDLKELHDQNVRVLVAGDVSKLPRGTREAVDEASTRTANNSGLDLIFALNYGGRDELIQAMRTIAIDVQNGEISPEEIDEAMIGNRLMTNMHDVDLIIRTSGEQRLSNFLLWQGAYAELHFTDVLWPEFKRDHFVEAIEAYNARTRRFGGV